MSARLTTKTLQCAARTRREKRAVAFLRCRSGLRVWRCLSDAFLQARLPLPPRSRSSKRNPYWNEQYESYVRGLAARLEYRVLEGAGHFLMVDKSEEFDSILAHFLVENRLLQR